MVTGEEPAGVAAKTEELMEKLKRVVFAERL
jgi:hypothetical protein